MRNLCALLYNGILRKLRLFCFCLSVPVMLCYDMIWFVWSLRPNDFWYGTKCCTELSAAMRVTSRIRARHLLSSYIHELGLRPIWAYGQCVWFVRPKAILCELLGLRPICIFWYETKCCTELSATVWVTSRICTRHLLGSYIHEQGRGYSAFWA